MFTLIVPEIPEANFSDLCFAISQKSCSLACKELNRFTYTFSPEAAFRLLGDALVNGLPLKVFKAILDRSPPVPELFSDGNLDRFRPDAFGLIENAALNDRADVLSLLLERGASPNRNRHYFYSPLESALIKASPKCVKVLMRHPELDTAWTDELLLQWAMPGAARDLCRRAMAPRFTGWKPGSSRPLPIPEPLTAPVIAKAGNWPLLERFCRERGPFSLEDGREIIRILGIQATKALAEAEEAEDSLKLIFLVLEAKEEVDISACTGALTALLESCPGLLRGERACRALLRCFFGFGWPARKLLLPWVESLGRRRIAMDAADWFLGKYGKFPDYWKEQLPNGPVLVIDRWTDLFDSEIRADPSLGRSFISELYAAPMPLPETLRSILSACPVRGKGRKGKLSPLAGTVLRCGDVPLIEALCRQPGGLLATEDPDALIDFVLQDVCSRANRAAALAYIRKEEKDYAL